MKFARYFLLTILVILKLVSETMAKKKMRHPTQSTRNYRKLHTDPSYNPLPSHHTTGPRYNFARHIPHKYRAYNSGITNLHTYTDTTKAMAEKARNIH